MKVNVLQTNFTGGEISPRLHGRPDLAKYADSLKEARDCVVLQAGGVCSRPGTDWLGEVKDSSQPTRLVPFVFSVDDAYILEFGNAYIRVWKNGALVTASSVPYEIASPYSTAELDQVDYTQGADTMLLALATKMIRRLRRFADDRWAIDEAPISPMPFSSIGRRQAVAITLGATAPGSTTAAGTGVFLDADVGRTLTHRGGIATITAVADANNATVNITTAFGSVTLPASEWQMQGVPQTTCTPPAAAEDLPVGASINLTFAADAIRADELGWHIQINGGLVRITTVTAADDVTGVILEKLTGDTAASADAWTLEAPVWNAVDGYPRTVTLHQQRLVAAGSPRYPQTVWGSRSGLYFDFQKGVQDDASYSFELSSDEINPVRYLSSNRDLVALTYRGEWTLNGGIEKPITPTNVRAVPQANVGCADVRPEQIDDDLFYIQRGTSALRTVLWSLQMGGYQSSEVSTFADHLFRPGVVGITWQQSPERIAWMQRADGKYLSATMSREQNIRPVTLCTPGGDGVVESMATIPEGGEDRTYMIVRRTINGVTKRYVERMNWAAYQDSRVTRSPASVTVTGLSHLAGKVVSAVADSVDLGDFTVSETGQITLPRAAGSVSVGFRFTPVARMLATETGTGAGASSGTARMNGSGKVLLLNTIGCAINGKPLAFRRFESSRLDEPVQAFSGWVDASEFGWAVDSDEVEISQPQSYPWCVLAVVRRITVNPG